MNMEAVPVAENRVPVGRPLGTRIAVGIAALSVGLQLLTKAMLFRTLSQAPDLKAAASSIPLWLNLFSWAYLIGLAASAYGVWMRQRAARIVFNALLAITLVTAVVSTLNIVANLSAARSLTPQIIFPLMYTSLIYLGLKVGMLVAVNLRSSRAWLDRGAGTAES